MNLRHRCEGNSTPSGKHEEHVTPLWFILNDRSRALVKAARAIAKKEHPNGENNG